VAALHITARPRGHATFVVDMTRTRFCDSARLGALVRAHKRAEAEGGELRLVIPTSAAVLRVFAITGIDRVIPNFPSLYEAVVPAPAAAPRPPRPRRRPKPGMRPRADRPPPDPAPAPARPERPPGPAPGTCRGLYHTGSPVMPRLGSSGEPAA
jgi:anti-anti-sigma factor